MTTKKMTTTKPAQMNATPTDAYDDVCQDCRTAEALANDPILAPPPGSFLHYLVTLPSPLSRARDGALDNVWLDLGHARSTGHDPVASSALWMSISYAP